MSNEEEKIKIPENPKSDADRAVLALGEALQKGAKLSPEFSLYLEGLVQAQKATVKTEAPLEGKRTNVDEIAATVQAQERVTLNGAWKEYWHPSTLKEFQQLSPVDIALIDDMAQRLAQETAAFKSPSTKPLGLIDMYKQDWCAVSVKSPCYNMSGLIQSIQQSLPPDLVKIGETIFEENTIHLYDFPGEPNFAVIKCLFHTPPNTSDCDNRPMKHDYWLVIPKGSIYKDIKAGKGLKLFPFILRNAAAIMDPQKSVFFDGSLAGNDGLFGVGENPISTIDYAERKITRIDDTRKANPTHKISHASNDQQFAQFTGTIKKGREKKDFNRYNLQLVDVSDRTYKRAPKPQT